MINLDAIQSERENPYVGFRPFFVEDALYFFGRDDQTSAMLECLRRHRFVSVVGNSGSGKSSLVMAGVIPTLVGGFLVSDRDAWQFGVMRPGDAPLENLAEALMAALGTEVVGVTRDEFAHDIRARGARAVHEVLARRTPGTNVLVLADQFEELFAYMAAAGSDLTDPPGRQVDHSIVEDRIRRQSDAQTFVSVLMAMAVPPNEHVYVITTMRTDFLGDCDRFAGLPELINSAGYLVPRLSRQDLREAVEGPARLKRVRVAPRLSDFVLNEIGDKPDLLPILQHALHRTWEARAESGDNGPLDLKHLEVVGGLRQALSNEADTLVAGVDERTLATVFRRLTRVDAGRRRVRRPCTLSELVAVSGASREMLAPFLDRLSREGTNLLYKSASAEAGDPRYDISHESLIRQWSRLQHWIDEERELAKFYAELCEKAARLRDTGELSETSLAARRALRRDVEARQMNEVWASRYANEVPATWQEVQAYLLQGRRKQRNWIAGMTSLAAALVLVFGALSWRQLRDGRWSEQQFNIATANTLTETDPTYGLWLAAGWPLDRYGNASVMASLDNLEQRYTALAEFTDVTLFEPVDHGMAVAIARSDGSVHVVSSHGMGEPVASLAVDMSVMNMLWLGDRTLLLLMSDGRVIHWHYGAADRRAHMVGTWELPSAWKRSMLRLANSNRAVIQADSGIVVLFESRTERTWTLPKRFTVLATHPADSNVVVGSPWTGPPTVPPRNSTVIRYGLTDNQVTPIRKFAESVPLVTFSAGGQFLLTAGEYSKDPLVVFDSTGRPIRSHPPRSYVTSLQSIGSDSGFIVADFDGGVSVLTTDPSRDELWITRHQGAATALRVPGAPWVVSGDGTADLRATLIDTSGYAADANISVGMRGHSTDDGITQLRATSRYIFSLDGRGLLRVWPVAKLAERFAPSFADALTYLRANWAVGDGIAHLDRSMLAQRAPGIVHPVSKQEVPPDMLSADGSVAIICERPGPDSPYYAERQCWSSFKASGFRQTLPIERQLPTDAENVRFTADGASLLVQVTDDTLAEFSTATGKSMHQYPIGRFTRWEVTANGRWMVFDTDTAPMAIAFDDPERRARKINRPYVDWRLAPGGSGIAFRDGETVSIASLETISELAPLDFVLDSAEIEYFDYRVNAEGTLLATLRDDQQVVLYELDRGRQKAKAIPLPRSGFSLMRVAFLPWGQSLLGVAPSGNALVWQWRPRGVFEDDDGRPSWTASMPQWMRKFLGKGSSTAVNDVVVTANALLHYPRASTARDETPPKVAVDSTSRQIILYTVPWFGPERVAVWTLAGPGRREVFGKRRAACLGRTSLESVVDIDTTAFATCASAYFGMARFSPIEPLPAPPEQDQSNGKAGRAKARVRSLDAKKN